ncbi:TPA: aldo/keto reductase [Klebsiella pneumoniae]
MQYTRLGKSDLLVSRICMGCMGFGDPSTGQHRWTLDETASRDIIRHALEQGINFYDTAIAYQNGSSERYVGRALREMAKREEVVLATKFLPRTAAQIAEGISGKQAIARSLDQSLRNLGMDYIDLYIYHIWDYNTPVIDVLEALHTAVTAGKVRAIGISNCYAWQLAKANTLAERHQVSMTEISLAWLLTKVTAPVIGATQKHHVDGAVNAVALQLSPEDIRYLEEAYQPHVLTGVMAQNTPQAKDHHQVWTR